LGGDDEVGGLADGADTLELLLGDGDVELFLDGHHELDQIEAVGVEIVFEAGVLGDERTLDAEDLHGSIGDLVEDFLAVHTLHVLLMVFIAF